MKSNKSMHLCRVLVCIQFGVLLGIMLLGSFSVGFLKGNELTLTWATSALVVISLLLSILIHRTARCPKCGKNLFDTDSPWRFALLLLILMGGNPVCKKCEQFSRSLEDERK